MKKIIIIGAGAMGSAFAIPCIENKNEVSLVGTHLEDDLINEIKLNSNLHPALNIELPTKLKVEKYEKLKSILKGGVDIIWIETMSAAKELKSAIIAAKKVKKPIFCTCSFDSHGKTMMGLEPNDLVSLAESFYPGVIGYGANCGIGTAELIGTLICLARARKNKSMHIIAKANCGMPELKDGQAKYRETPKYMSLYANYAKKIGATIIGGCCGTKPEHTKEIENNIKDYLDSNIEIDSITNELGNMSSRNISLIKSLPRKVRRENKRRRIRL